MKLLHGTSEREWKFIQESGGLDKPYLTRLETVAWFFADSAAEISGSPPIVLEVEVPDTEHLEADLPMFYHPIMEVFEELGYPSAYAYLQAAQAGDIPWPRNRLDWETSLDIVKSIRYRGVIPIKNVKVYERAL